MKQVGNELIKAIGELVKEARLINKVLRMTDEEKKKRQKKQA